MQPIYGRDFHRWFMVVSGTHPFAKNGRERYSLSFKPPVGPPPLVCVCPRMSGRKYNHLLTSQIALPVAHFLGFHSTLDTVYTSAHVFSIARDVVWSDRICTEVAPSHFVHCRIVSVYMHVPLRGGA